MVWDRLIWGFFLFFGKSAASFEFSFGFLGGGGIQGLKGLNVVG